MVRRFRTVAVIGAAVTAAATVALSGTPAAEANPPTPVISSFTPSSATVGAVVTITGTDLSDASVVAFNLIDAQIDSDTATQITATVPLGEDQGPVTVTTPGGTATSSTVFTLLGFYVADASIPDAVRGVDYQVQLETAGGTGPYRWRETGALPKGMSMNRNGVLSGVPNLKKDATGSYPFTVHVRDSTKHGHLEATQALTLVLS